MQHRMMAPGFVKRRETDAEENEPRNHKDGSLRIPAESAPTHLPKAPKEDVDRRPAHNNQIGGRVRVPCGDHRYSRPDVDEEQEYQDNLPPTHPRLPSE